MTNRTITSILVLALQGIAATCYAEDKAPPIYVGEFQPVQAPSEGFGPVHAIFSDLHKHHVDEVADELSYAIVDNLQRRQATASLMTFGKNPSSGWIVRGVFYSMNNGRLISIPSLASNDMPNIEVTVTIADAARDPDKPFAIIGTDAILKGQGAPLGWNPYVVAARFAANRLQTDSSIKTLAEQIAEEIMADRDSISSHD